MSSGLQIWDSSGKLIVDTSTLLPRRVEIGEVTSAGSATIIDVASGANIGLPQIEMSGDAPPNVTLSSSGVLSWERGGYPFRSRLSVALL